MNSHRVPRTRGSQDVWGGVALAGVGLLALYAARDLPGMNAHSLGPGSAPRLFAFLLVGLGIAIAVGGRMSGGPDLPSYSWRGLLFVSLAVIAFALLIRPLGLIGTTFATYMIAALGSAEQRWSRTVVVGIAITVFCVLLFTIVLGLPFQLRPEVMP